MNGLSDLESGSYCGFCVTRPLSNAPVGRTTLSARIETGLGIEATVTCRADNDVHILGTQLRVTGTAFIQQDARVGACAQVAIWVGMRHMHARHYYNWVSVADITRLAGPPSLSEAFSIPNSSDCLSTDAMVRAISNAGYQPLCIRGPEFASAMLPYVESGIPVILGLSIGGTVGHTVAVIGCVFAKQVKPTNRAIDYVPAFIVHDDQSGPYMWLPTDEQASTTFSFSHNTIKRDLPDRPIELNIKHHAVFGVALMSTRVFSTAARAELNAKSLIDQNLNALPAARKDLTKLKISVNDKLVDELLAAHSSDELILRTYLTSAAGYRRHLAQCSASDNLKDALLHIHLPHFTWITEFFTLDTFNQTAPEKRRIYGHTVLDATSITERKDSLLVFHLPGLLLTRDPDSRDQDKATIIEDDRLYEARQKRF